MRVCPFADCLHVDRISRTRLFSIRSIRHGIYRHARRAHTHTCRQFINNISTNTQRICRWQQKENVRFRFSVDKLFRINWINGHLVFSLISFIIESIRRTNNVCSINSRCRVYTHAHTVIYTRTFHSVLLNSSTRGFVYLFIATQIPTMALFQISDIVWFRIFAVFCFLFFMFFVSSSDLFVASARRLRVCERE